LSRPFEEAREDDLTEEKDSPPENQSCSHIRVSCHALLCDELTLLREAEAKNRAERKRKEEERRREQLRRQNERKKQEEKRAQAAKEEREKKAEIEREKRERMETERRERQRTYEAARLAAERERTKAEQAHAVALSFEQESKLEQQVSRVIARAGGKPRRDSVECLEFIFTASPEFFEADKDARGDVDLERLEAFVEHNMEFMSDCTAKG
jgi:hypothetical protein